MSAQLATYTRTFLSKGSSGFQIHDTHDVRPGTLITWRTLEVHRRLPGGDEFDVGLVVSVAGEVVTVLWNRRR